MLIQSIYTIALITGNGSGYMLYDSPQVNAELINSGEFIKTLDQNTTLYAEEPSIIYFARRILFINVIFDQPSENATNLYYAYDQGFSRNNLGNKPLDYYLSNYTLVHNFSNYVYLFKN